jgi:hypothetical protein
MTSDQQTGMAVCGHTIEQGTCTLPAGHNLGHHDETRDFQWWDRADDYGPGAYAGIRPGDPAWRHDHGKCVEVGVRRDWLWCVWCLRRRVIGDPEGRLPVRADSTPTHDDSSESARSGRNER